MFVDNMKNKINYDKHTIEETNKNKENETKNDEDDYVTKSMGAFGRWQAIACVIMALSRIMAMWNIMSILFLTSPTEFICTKMKGNVTFEVENSTCYSDCLEYKFKNKVFENNLVSDFGLICDRAWMASFTQFVLMFGLTLGISVFGWVSDRFGRKRGIISSVVLDVIFMVAAPFATNYWTFTILRFFVGLASGGIMSITTVFTMETVGSKHREISTSLSLAPDGIAQATLAAFAYFAPSWRVYLWEYSAFSVLFLILLMFIPETPRWLMANGKSDKAVILMTKAAKFNNLPTSAIKENVTKSLQELNLKQNELLALNYLDIFKTKRLSVITISSVIVWFTAGLCYYGLNQYITVLGSNTFIVVAIAGVAQFSMLPLASVTTRVYGRKASVIASYLVVGVVMAAKFFSPVGSWVATALVLTGVLASSFTFCVLYLYVTELYPTPVRNMGFSLSSAGSKFGAMIAPFVAAVTVQGVAVSIFAVMAFIAVAICFLLPETKGQKLSDTVNE